MNISRRNTAFIAYGALVKVQCRRISFVEKCEQKYERRKKQKRKRSIVVLVCSADTKTSVRRLAITLTRLPLFVKMLRMLHT